MTENTISIEMLDITQQHTTGKNRKRLFDFIRRKISSDSDAEDILQDVFYQLWDTLQNEPIQQVTAWLYRVADNKVIDWYRKRKTVSLEKLNNPTATAEDEGEYSLHLEDSLFDPAETPDELLVRSTFWDMLTNALDELPEEQREAFVLHEIEGRSFKEISELTGTPVNTLLSRKRYAVLFLREQLQDMYDEYLEK
jgi:RNA polymerase sigma factor (sigma-70 family)